MRSRPYVIVISVVTGLSVVACGPTEITPVETREAVSEIAYRRLGQVDEYAVGAVTYERFRRSGWPSFTILHMDVRSGPVERDAVVVLGVAGGEATARRRRERRGCHPHAERRARALHRARLARGAAPCRRLADGMPGGDPRQLDGICRISTTSPAARRSGSCASSRGCWPQATPLRRLAKPRLSASEGPARDRAERAAHLRPHPGHDGGGVRCGRGPRGAAFGRP